MLDAVRGDLGDVDHALFAGCELDESAEFLDADDYAVEDLAFFELGGDDLDHALCFVHALLLAAADGDAAVIVDVDLDACALDDLVDGLAALADNITDLLGIDLHEVDLGSVLVDCGTGLGNGVVHNAVHDEHSGFTAACDGACDDVLCQAVDLDVHLDGSDAVLCAGHLEVHVAEEVFETLDVGEEDEIIVGLACDQTAADACDGLLDRDACSHKGHAGRAGGSHGCGTVGFEGLGDRTDRIGELIDGRQDGHERTLSQSAVSDLAAAGASGDSGLAYGIGREIVVVDIALLGDVGVKAINALCLRKGCQCDDVTDLGLSAGEHSTAVDAGDDVDFCCQRTDLIQSAAVGTLVVLEDHLADGLLFILIDCLVEDGKPLFVVGKCFAEFFLESGDVGFAGLLVVCEDCFFHLCGRNDLFDGCEELFGDGAALILALLLAAVGDNALDPLDDLLVLLICDVDAADHFFIGDLVGACLDHHDLVFSGSNSQLKVALVPLLLGRIDDDFAVYHADLGHGDGAVEGDIGNLGGQSGAVHGDELRSAGGLDTHDQALEGDVIAHVLGEQGAHGTVDDTAGQDRVLAGSSLALVKAAGELAYCIEFLGVLHAEREKVDPVAGFLRSRGGTENCCVAVVHERAAAGLLADAVDVDAQCTSADFQ